jgi:hypothetical protein
VATGSADQKQSRIDLARRAVPLALPVFWGLAFAVTVVAAGVSAFLAPAAAPTLVQILQAVASVPVVVLVLAVMFAIAFRPQIEALIGRLSALTFLGLDLRASPPPAEAPSSLTGGGRSSDKTAREATFWYLQFVAKALPPIAIAMLRWMRDKEDVGAKEIPYSLLIDTLRVNGVTDPTQQSLVWNAIRQYGLAEAQGDAIKITRGGRDFMAFLEGRWRPLDEDRPR